MSESTPNPAPGAVPPKPPEAAKVQPKKETVRINLPPKPAAVPTIKIPAPAAAAAPVAAKPAAVPVAASAPPPPTPAPKPAATPAAAAVPRPTVAPRAVGPSISGVDTGLAVAAAVICVIAFVRVLLLV